jgi:hypothetical protein
VGVGVGALALLVLAACSPEAPAPAPAPEATLPAVGPLEACLGFSLGLQSQGEVAAELAAREEAVAACMAEQGFDYVPMVMVPGSYEVADEPLRGTHVFAEAYGYGVWHGPEIEPGQFTYQLDDSANRAYRDSLSPLALAAYDEALMGAMTVEGDTTKFDGVGACASAGPFRDGGDAAYLRDVSEEMSDYLEALARGDDPRLAEVDAAWASCMADAGYDEASPRAAEWRVIDEFIAADELTADVVAENTALERRLALADIDCREATDWAVRRRAIEYALQQEYVDSHRADLDALVAAFTGE